MDITALLHTFNYNFTLFIVFPLIVIFGLYLTLKLRCVQVTKLKQSFASLVKTETSDEGNISRFGAIATILAGNFGTGNISGMAIAIATGGPGALVWMWIMAFLGAAIQYASCILSVMFRKKGGDDEFVGGPMYYLRDGLGYKWIAALFAIFTLIAAITAGSFAQINSILLPLQTLGWDPLYSSLGIALIVGTVILGGIQRISYFASYIVPFKALLYLGAASVIILFNYEKVPNAFMTMMRSAFDLSSIAGGVLGMGVFKALTTGFDRGLFATDAGTGLAPILQASTRSKNPVLDGITSLVAPWMVMVVCTITGLVVLITGAWQMPNLKSTNMVTYAFTQGLNSQTGGYIVIIALMLFALTTILAWAYCGEKALGYLIGPKKAIWFRVLFITSVPLSAFVHVGLIWTMADIAITCMLVANLIGVIRLSSRVIDASRTFEKQQKRKTLSQELTLQANSD